MYDGRRPPSDRDVDRLAQAVEGTAASRTVRRGPFALAWIGGDSHHAAPTESGPFVHLHGALFNLGDLERGAPTDGVGPATRWARLYDTKGLDLLGELRGDFVVVRYDPRSNDGLLARDQLGGKGVVVHSRGDRLYFASEVRHLLRLLPSRPEPDAAGLAHWLGMSGMPGDRTLFESVRRLPAAHVLRFGGGGGPRTLRYWAPRYQPPVAGSPSEHARGLHGRLVDAVGRRTGANTGVLLSGGLDSSSVAAVASALPAPARPDRAYSAVFPRHPTIDESTLIDRLCSELGLRSTRVVVRSGSVLSGAIEYLRHWDLPPSSPNLFFWFPLLRRAAADGVVALLDGEGGDELFGLSPYLIADRLRVGRVHAAVRLARGFPGGGPHVGWGRLRPVLRDFGVKGLVPPRVERAVRRARGSARYVPGWLRPPLAAAYAESDVAADWKEIGGPRWWAFLVDATTRGMGPALTYDHVRRRAMLCGLEARHPLVDVDVVEYVLRLPPELAYDTRWSRPILRAATEGVLPDEVRLRPAKSVFDALFHESLAGPDLPVVRTLLMSGPALAAYVDIDAVRRLLLDEAPTPQNLQWWALSVWRLVTAECWLRHLGGTDLDGLAGLAAADLTIQTPP